MSRKDELIEQLIGMAGTPSELAAAVGVKSSDATFRRALEAMVRDGLMVAEGSSRDRTYRPLSEGAPRREAGGFGAAREKGIYGAKGSQAMANRTTAFARMSANAVAGRSSAIGSGKV